MTRLEIYTLFILGFFLFELIIIRLSFLIGISITNITLPISFVLYIFAGLFAITNIVEHEKQQKKYFLSLGCAAITLLTLFCFSFILSNTYDTSWDGQGYHQTGVISLVKGWNPIWHPPIELAQRLPSQIFAEGYPSALWEIEASIYALTGKINSAKVVNIYIAIIAFCMLYSVLRKFSFGKTLAFFSSFFMVIQPVYVLQLLTFMQDGFGYELILIAASSLTIIAAFKKAIWAIPVFLITEIMLVSIKYNLLPIALVLGSIFVLIVINRLFNEEYKLNKLIKIVIVCFLFLSLLFASTPYIRNVIAYRHPFYPTNIPELMGSVAYNNIPTNLDKDNKINLLFYGIFSKSQSIEAGDPRSEKNIAELKMPFIFSPSEVQNSVGLYNNRVGAGGPLFSGIVLLSFIFLVFMSFNTKTRKERYAIYTSYFGFITILAISMTTPAPNLMRYASQLQLLPLAIIIPLHAVYKQSLVKVTTSAIILLIGMNVLIYALAVAQFNRDSTEQINRQFSAMKLSGKTYYVTAQHLYSNYILLNEKNIHFYAVTKLPCRTDHELVLSSKTTLYCSR